MVEHANAQHITISIHALREEGDPTITRKRRRYLNFYPRPPRGGRPAPSLYHFAPGLISIHALREEGDVCTISCFLDGGIFLSTPSARRATVHPHQIHHRSGISIHALREEGDVEHSLGKVVLIMISIHALREEGDLIFFLSLMPWMISIHALREEGDGYIIYFYAFTNRFLSTPSARRATEMILRSL